MAHAKAVGLVEDDPSLTVRAPKVKLVGHAVWTAGEIERFRAHWQIGAVQRACFELLLWTGTRTIDAVAIGPQHVGRDGVLFFHQRKTGGPAHVPWTAPLPEWAMGWDAERRGMIEALKPLAGGLTFLQARGRRPRSEKGLSNLISAAARDAKLTGKTAHGLRKARLTAIAEAGALRTRSWIGAGTRCWTRQRTTPVQRTPGGWSQEQDRNRTMYYPPNLVQKKG
ncbi:hypothetical protein KTN05_16220 [Paracoccus sp. Z118]|uniref:hypothetical protein n=1 Tax=Paracoccus sp. Z118 TaxID=2851017 RepID=UPI001C2CB3C2|nr:hypothetical protein [Paracoccus sp. Z118]MBV0893359.1 hypothetical protein [Paracoccus sp. Z118]